MFFVMYLIYFLLFLGINKILPADITKAINISTKKLVISIPLIKKSVITTITALIIMLKIPKVKTIAAIVKAFARGLINMFISQSKVAAIGIT